MKSLHRVLCRAVGRLQGDPAVRERRADLNDRATIARLHPPQCCQRAPYIAEVGYVGDATIIVRRHFHYRREDGEHGVVDPDVDWSEHALDFRGRLFDGVVITDVEW